MRSILLLAFALSVCIFAPTKSARALEQNFVVIWGDGSCSSAIPKSRLPSKVQLERDFPGRKVMEIVPEGSSKHRETCHSPQPVAR